MTITPPAAASAASLPIPLTKNRVDLSAEQLDNSLIVGFDGLDPRSRPFNLLRTQFSKVLSATAWNLIGLTSATPSAGKTFTALNLAAALSRTENRPIILCDFDLRRGAIARQIGLRPTLTLDDFLGGKITDWQDALLAFNSDNLLLLPVRAGYVRSGEFLTSELFARLMADLRALSRTHLILCDLPPVFANDDAMLTASFLDAYLFIVDHGRTTRRQIDESLALLAPTPCLGTVLNRYSGGFADDYGYGYGDVYGLREYADASAKNEDRAARPNES